MKEEGTNPSSSVSVIETDAFCESCGFNLHTQKVWRDERLGIAVCRCPECGNHHPAGMRTTAGSAWLRRLALVGLLIWFGIAILFTVGGFFLFLGDNMATDGLLITSRYEASDGVPVYLNTTKSDSGATVRTWTKYGQSYVGQAAPTVVPDDQVVHRTKFVPIELPWQPPIASTDYYSRGTPLIALVLVGAIFAIAEFAVGCIAAAGSWFWRPAWRWAWLALPLLALVLSVAVLLEDRGPVTPGIAVEGGRLTYMVLFGSTMMQLLILALGLLVGRRVIRLLLTVFIPPKSRQLFAFLWHCDGKTMPTSKV